MNWQSESRTTGFLYIIELCLQGFNKGIPLGFYISQWLANYLLEPLDRLITEVLGLPKLQRYMDDIVIFASSKKVLQRAIVEIRKMLGQRFRLKLKHNYQVCKFYYEKGKRKIGRALDFMGFIFYRNKTLIRKNIMLSATRLAKKMERSKQPVDPFTDTSKPCCRTWDGLPARTHTTVTRAG